MKLRGKTALRGLRVTVMREEVNFQMTSATQEERDEANSECPPVYGR